MTNLPAMHSDTGQEVIDPDTGEVVTLEEATPALLARVSERLQDLGRQARDARSLVEHELARRLAAFRERSLDVGSHEISLVQRRDWDAEATWVALGALIEAGLVTTAEVDEAMPERVERKPDGRKLNALLTRIVGEDPEAASALARARSSRDTVRIKPLAMNGTAETA